MTEDEKKALARELANALVECMEADTSLQKRTAESAVTAVLAKLARHVEDSVVGGARKLAFGLLDL